MKIKLPEKFLPRLIMTLLGVIICAIAVGFFKNSLFGIDPFQPQCSKPDELYRHIKKRRT